MCYFYLFSVPPRIDYVSNEGEMQVKKGSTVTLQCKASGNPVPTITWTRKVIPYSFIFYPFYTNPCPISFTKICIIEDVINIQTKNTYLVKVIIKIFFCECTHNYNFKAQQHWGNRQHFNYTYWVTQFLVLIQHFLYFIEFSSACYECNTYRSTILSL